jgi:hypothetical protein
MPPDAVYVNCSADGLPSRAPEPIFQPGVIKLQYVRRCSPTFSAAMIAHLEATIEGDAKKNALSEPIPPPDEPRDWLRMHVIEARNRYSWSQSPELGAWLVGARLDRFSGMIAQAIRTGDPAHSAILARYKAATQPAMARLSQLLT